MNAACIKKSMCVVETENQCRGRESRERVDLWVYRTCVYECNRIHVMLGCASECWPNIQ